MDFPEIIGCGPSGSIFSYSFDGKSVIYEEHSKIGYPVRCAGLISEKAYSFFKKIGVNLEDCVDNKINEAEINIYGKKVYIGLKGILLDRGKFDRVLAEHAETKAKIIRKRVREEDLKRMKVIIGADGPFSLVAKAFKFDPTSYAFAYQKKFTDERENENIIKVYFFDSSFGYIIPNFKEKIVGIVFFKDPKREFANFFFKGFKGKEIDSFAAVIPIKMRKEISKKINGKRIHLTGDAAGIVKATSGGGIYYGCLYSYYLGKYFYEEEKLKAAEMEIRKKLKLHTLVRRILNEKIFLKFLSLLPEIKISYDMEEILSISPFKKFLNPFSFIFP
jgi:digeranylgeranylglycerophospholipid reductase